MTQSTELLDASRVVEETLRAWTARRWRIAVCRFQAKYPLCWKLFGALAMDRLRKLPKKYKYWGDNEYELLEEATFMPRSINQKLKKGA